MEEYILHYDDEDKSSSTILLSSFDPPNILTIRDKGNNVLFVFQYVGGSDYLQIPKDETSGIDSIEKRWEEYQSR